MRIHLIASVIRAASFVLIASACAASATQSAPVETITAVAEVTSGGAATATPVTIVIGRVASDAERDALIRAVKSGGTEAARELLAKRGDAGTLRVGSQTVALKYVLVRVIAGGRLITAVTDQPIAVPGTSATDSKPKGGYGLGLVLIEVPKAGAGHGELVPAGRIRIDEHDAVVTEASNPANVVTLTKVAVAP